MEPGGGPDLPKTKSDTGFYIQGYAKWNNPNGIWEELENR